MVFLIEITSIFTYNIFIMIEKTKKIIEDETLLSKALPFIDASNPEFVFIPTINSRCNSFELKIKPGDHVYLGQTIGSRKGPFFDQFIHSTVSGTFVCLEKHGYKNGKAIDFIKIKNDYLDKLDSSIKERTEEEIKLLTKEQFVEICRNCSLVGLGGSSFPTYIKLTTKDKITTLVFNGVECEPFINADHRLMIEESKKLIQGIKYLLKFFDCHKAIIVYKNKYKDQNLIKLLDTRLGMMAFLVKIK